MMRTKGIVAVSCAGLLGLALGLFVQNLAPRARGAQGGLTREEEKQRQEKILKAAEDYAAAVSNGDATKYYEALQYAIDGSKRLAGPAARERGLGAAVTPIPSALPRALGAAPSPFAQTRSEVKSKAATSQSIKSDPTWQRNQRRLLQEARAEDPGRIFGGRVVPPGEFPDCVTVGSLGQFCCTGTLIGRNVVVTAGHCSAGGCASRIFIGDNSNLSGSGRIIKVKKAVRHPDFNPVTLANDLTVLILEEEATGVTPRKIASKEDVDNAFYLRLVGFGLNEESVFGIKAMVDVAIASNSCGDSNAQSKFGCNANREIVAGGNGLDSCNGDSGGPAYIMKGAELFLAGATSRATANALSNCGDGGIYVRVDTYADWIRQTAEDNGGQMP